MQLRIIGIICLVVVPIYSLPAADNPFESAFDAGSVSALRSTGHQPNAQFGERIKDWFRRVKNRIFGKKETTTPSPLDRAKEMFTEVDTADLQYAQRHPEGFYVDLSRIRFDPKTDWGFRLGKWYFIRKVSDSMETNDWNKSGKIDPSWPTSKGTTPINDIPHGMTSIETLGTSASMEDKSPEVTISQEVLTSISTPRSTPNVVTRKVTTAEDVTTRGATTNIATSTVATIATTKFPDPRENETHKKKDQSAEVIGPED